MPGERYDSETATNEFPSYIRAGNLLGSPRAESDAIMLRDAFLQTADYASLTESRDRNFVVGRRGTGKSALFTKVSEYYQRAPQTFVLSGQPTEYEAIRLQYLLSQDGASYQHMRAASRVAWTVHILAGVAEDLRNHYKAVKSEHLPFLADYLSKHKSHFSHRSVERCADLIAHGLSSGAEPAELPGKLAKLYDLRRLEQAVTGALMDINWVAVLLYDGLDEGWVPSPSAISVLDGLTSAVADLAEHQSGVHGILFIRDNMFRALAHLHTDFSRQIEGSTQRLHWDEATLFDFVCSRLRAQFSLDIESNERVWNRVVDKSLAGRRGFEKCLRHTLYRPRDILVLVNSANDVAARRGDHAIGQVAVDGAATRISEDRLADLLKEYDSVLPGLRSFVAAFDRRPAVSALEDVVSHLDSVIEDGAYEDQTSSDFALFGTGTQVMSALYGVGFLGFENLLVEGQYTFCHDGSRSDTERYERSRKVVVHPCYWRALEVDSDEPNANVLIRINDDYEVPGDRGDMTDLRVRQIGRALAELPGIPTGHSGSAAFEKWVLSAVRILFAGKLQNAELHANPHDAPQRRDIVATNMAASGFWKRVFEDFGARQVMIEVKNYESLKPEDYRQALSYMTTEHGKLGVVVYRTEQEGVSANQRTWLREVYHEHDRIVFTVPATLLKKGIAKMRNPGRFDWIESQLNRRLDKFQRNYLKIVQAPARKRPRKARKNAKRKRRGW